MSLLPEDSNMAAQAICHAAQMTQETIRQAISQYERPSAVYKPKLFKDGNKWCALLGGNIQDGVCGFGDTPSDAMWEFDIAWGKP